MTFTKLLGYGITLSIIMVAVKVFAYRAFNWEEAIVLHYFFWAFCAWLAVIFIRRLGIISFLEAFVVMGVWMFFHLFTDLIITASILGLEIFLDTSFLMGYFVMIVGMFIFHKKRHVAVRKEMVKK